jgi:hypothetical protein
MLVMLADCFTILLKEFYESVMVLLLVAKYLMD